MRSITTDDRYVPFLNSSGEEIPAWGVFLGSEPDEDGTVTATKPDGSDGPYFVNGPVAIAAAGHGGGTQDSPCQVLCTGAPAAGETWGPASGSWALATAGTGFLAMSVAADGKAWFGFFFNKPLVDAYQVDQAFTLDDLDGIDEINIRVGTETGLEYEAYFHFTTPITLTTEKPNLICWQNRPTNVAENYWNIVFDDVRTQVDRLNAQPYLLNADFDKTTITWATRPAKNAGLRLPGFDSMIVMQESIPASLSIDLGGRMVWVGIKPNLIGQTIYGWVIHDSSHLAFVDPGKAYLQLQSAALTNFQGWAFANSLL